jgi:hypothetical protein
MTNFHKKFIDLFNKFKNNKLSDEGEQEFDKLINSFMVSQASETDQILQHLVDNYGETQLYHFLDTFQPFIPLEFINSFKKENMDDNISEAMIEFFGRHLQLLLMSIATHSIDDELKIYYECENKEILSNLSSLHSLLIATTIKNLMNEDQSINEEPTHLFSVHNQLFFLREIIKCRIKKQSNLDLTN